MSGQVACLVRLGARHPGVGVLAKRRPTPLAPAQRIADHPGDGNKHHDQQGVHGDSLVSLAVGIRQPFIHSIDKQ